MIAPATIKNPFSITNANDFSNPDILRFWVETPSAGENGPHQMRPESPMPIFVLGAKGSGKTHLMRYHSFPLQVLRFQNKGVGIQEGVEKDGYVGIYLRCSGLNAGRFSGKGQKEEVWDEVFAYYLELWLAKQVLAVAHQVGTNEGESDEGKLTCAIVALFDKEPEVKTEDVKSLIQFIENEHKRLDIEINNCVLTGQLKIEVTVTRGKLVFGIPKLIANHCHHLRETNFIYIIDELENLSASQQRLINSLVRDRDLPTTFRVGARLHGIKTHETDADQEENLPDSEFEMLVLDEEFRNSKGKYSKFARQLLGKRLSATTYGIETNVTNFQTAFTTDDELWNSPIYLNMVSCASSSGRVHFKRFVEKVTRVRMRNVEEIVANLAIYDYPMVEKASILVFYRAMRGGHDPLQLAKRIREEREAFVESGGRERRSNRVGSVIDHYHSDLAAQLRRENNEKQIYLGLDTFVAMSGGLPRALLTILRTVFDWAIYNEEDPTVKGGISIDSQYRGVNESSEWFFNSMRKSGKDGVAIQGATDRLAQVFRTSRFSDLPVECSLNTFSVAEHGLTEEARRVLKLCEERSFLNRIEGGQKHRNSMEVQMKFQIHPMLCPRWQLPIGRRGVMELKPEFANSIFEIAQEKEFTANLRQFEENRTFTIPTEEGTLF